MENEITVYMVQRWHDGENDMQTWNHENSFGNEYLYWPLSEAEDDLRQRGYTCRTVDKPTSYTRANLLVIWSKNGLNWGLSAA